MGLARNGETLNGPKHIVSERKKWFTPMTVFDSLMGEEESRVIRNLEMDIGEHGELVFTWEEWKRV